MCTTKLNERMSRPTLYEDMQTCSLCNTKFIDSESEDICPNCQDDLFEQLMANDSVQQSFRSNRKGN